MLRPECVIVLILQATFRKSAVQSKKLFHLVNVHSQYSQETQTLSTVYQCNLETSQNSAVFLLPGF